MDNSSNHIGNSQSYNHYSYTLNNPLKYTDPSGYNFIDDLGSCIEGFLTIITIPGRVLAGANASLDDEINGTPDPNGYFSAEYIINGVLPAPSSGFFALFEPGSGSGMLAARGNGFAAADGTFYSNGYLADEGWANYAANHQTREQGDFNNMDVLHQYDLMSWVETSGMNFNPQSNGQSQNMTKVKIKNLELFYRAYQNDNRAGIEIWIGELGNGSYWLQTFETNLFHGKFGDFQKIDGGFDNYPYFYDIGEESTYYSQYNMTFDDIPYRKFNNKKIYWRAELSVVSMNSNGGTSIEYTISYGFELSNGVNTILPPTLINNPSDFHKKLYYGEENSVILFLFVIILDFFFKNKF